MRKFISALTAAAMTVSIGAYAAAIPPAEGSQNIDLSQNKSMFHYKTSTSLDYADFTFKLTGYTDVVLTFSSDSGDHEITWGINDKTGRTVYVDTVTVLDDTPISAQIPFYSFSVENEYYVFVTAADDEEGRTAAKQYTGTVTVSGAKANENDKVPFETEIKDRYHDGGMYFTMAKKRRREINVPDGKNAVAISFSANPSNVSEYFLGVRELATRKYLTKGGIMDLSVGSFGEGMITVTGLKPNAEYDFRFGTAANNMKLNGEIEWLKLDGATETTFDVKEFKATAVEPASDGGLGLKDGDKVTRAQAAVLIAGLTPVHNDDSPSVVSGFDAGANKPPFSDVTENVFGKTEIKLMSEINIVNGGGGGLFRPNDAVTGEQAIKMLVTLIGYKPFAESLGGWPNGYVECGKKLGIACAEPTAAVTWNEFAKMLASADVAPHLCVSTYNVENGAATYYQNQNITFKRMREAIAATE